MPKIIATADLHGSLPWIPECDILLLGGDILPDDHQPQRIRNWAHNDFRHWLEEVPAQHIVGIAGNHDFLFEQEPWLPKRLPWTYLRDDLVNVEGLLIYGTPWVPNLPGWAFHGGMDNRCKACCFKCPSQVDIVLSHGPMYGYADHTGPRHGSIDVGCIEMAEVIEHVRPKAYVCGHIHEAYGHYEHPSIEYGVWSVSHNTEEYSPVNPSVELVDFSYT